MATKRKYRRKKIRGKGKSYVLARKVYFGKKRQRHSDARTG